MRGRALCISRPVNKEACKNALVVRLASWRRPPPGAKLSVVAVAQFWHFIPLNPAVLGGWRRWPAVREYGSSRVRRYRLRRPPTTNHCVVVGCRRHHGGSSGGGQFGPSGLNSMCVADRARIVLDISAFLLSSRWLETLLYQCSFSAFLLLPHGPPLHWLRLTVERSIESFFFCEMRSQSSHSNTRQ